MESATSLDDRIEALLDRAEELDVLPETLDFLEEFLDAAEQCEKNRGKKCEAQVALVHPEPTSVWVLGELSRVEYERDEDGEPVTRYHDFEDEKPTLAVDPKTKTLWIVGGDYDVTSWGIIG